MNKSSCEHPTDTSKLFEGGTMKNSFRRHIAAVFLIAFALVSTGCASSLLGPFAGPTPIAQEDETEAPAQQTTQSSQELPSQQQDGSAPTRAEFMYTVGHDRALVKSRNETGEVQWAFSGHNDWVAGLAMDEQGYLYTSGGDYKIRKIDPTDGSLIWTFKGHTYAVNSVAADGKGFLYTGGSDKNVKKITTGGNEVWNYRAEDVIHSVAVDKDGNLFTGARDGTVRKIDPDGNSLWTWKVPHINNIAVDPAGSVYAGGADETGLVKISSSGKQLWRYTGTGIKGSVTHITIGPDQIVYASDSAGGITKVDPEHGRVIKRFDGFADTLYGSAVDSDGLVYVGSKSGELFCLNFDTDEILWSRKIHSGPLRKVILSRTQSGENPALPGTVSSQKDQDMKAGSYEVGNTGPAGGIIAYINPSDEDSWSYLEVALPTWSGAEEDPAYPFGGRGVKIPDLADAVGSGMANTARIVETLTPLVSLEFAAAVCDDLVLGGFDDWFLPSQEEMTIIYENLAAHNIGSFHEKKAYMTSSKGNSINAQLFSMAKGTPSWGAKTAPFLVRPVRVF